MRDVEADLLGENGGMDVGLVVDNLQIQLRPVSALAAGVEFAASGR